ncbi:murein biosynthesis integral membrane protein MurJ [Planctomicrobium sp. SH668]|uniref:murein biosynthesis integral membrane protein MurJ n=1 Tax=Planctomicrobium sp. SH668 TaxID=3448126 RepID=UPI003F5C6B3E
MANVRLVSMGTVISRILGMLRDMGMASLFGAGTTLDAFLVAFRIPNLTRQLLGEGALSTAFLPLYVKCREENGLLAARQMMTAVALASACLLFSAVLLGESAIVLTLLYIKVSSATQVLLQLLAIMLPYSLLICLTALFCAALHAHRQFLWPAFVPIVLNLVWLIAMVIIWANVSVPFEQAALAATSVTFAGCLQLIVPIYALHRQGLGLIQDWKPGKKYVAAVFRMMIPTIVGMSILQSTALIDSLLAWGFSQPDDGSKAWCELWGIAPLLESGTASALYIGQRMYQFPVGVFGIALGTVLYPLLTQHASRGESDLLRKDLTRGVRLMLAIALPASAGLCVLAWPITLALFQRGEFSMRDAVLTSRIIATYGCGVWCYIGIAILNRAFYAMNDRITPLRLGTLALSLNIVLNLVLMTFLGGVGIALANVIAFSIQVILSIYQLNLRVSGLLWNEIVQTLWKSLLASVVMSIVCLLLLQGLNEPATTSQKLIYLGIPGFGGLLTFVVFGKLIGMQELKEIISRS